MREGVDATPLVHLSVVLKIDRMIVIIIIIIIIIENPLFNFAFYLVFFPVLGNTLFVL